MWKKEKPEKHGFYWMKTKLGCDDERLEVVHVGHEIMATGGELPICGDEYWSDEILPPNDPHHLERNNREDKDES